MNCERESQEILYGDANTIIETLRCERNEALSQCSEMRTELAALKQKYDELKAKCESFEYEQWEAERAKFGRM